MLTRLQTAAKDAVPEVDVEKLYDSTEWPAERMVDDAKGVTELWNLERAGPKFVKLSPAERGIFHTGYASFPIRSLTSLAMCSD